MLQRIFCFALLIISISMFSQEILFEKEIKMTSTFNDKRESIPIVRRDSSLLMALIDNKDILIADFDRDFNLKKTFELERPSSKYKYVQGYSDHITNVNLFFATSKNKKFLIFSIDLILQKVLEKEFIIDKGEEFVESFTDKGVFYIISLKKSSSVLNIYKFDYLGTHKKHIIDLSKYKFSDDSYYKLTSAMRTTEGLSSFLDIVKIDMESPKSIEITSVPNKLYCYDDTLYITMDKSYNTTYILPISLIDFSCDPLISKHEKLTNSPTNVKQHSNSLIYENKLYQVGVTSDELNFKVLDLQSNKVLKTYHINEEDNIDFKNTDLVQQKTNAFVTNAERELTKTKQILRKLSSSRVGVIVLRDENNYEITIGGYKEVQRAAFMPGMSMDTSFGVSGVGGDVTVGVNPVMNSYSTYTSQKSVFFTAIVNSNTFEHLEGEQLKSNVFDKIFEVDDSNPNTKCETIFKIEDFYVFGFYDSLEKKYYLLKFEV